MDQRILKNQVHDYWNESPCGNDTARQSADLKSYYDEIEAYRYKYEAVIFSFAQFTRYFGKRMLEVGVGMGTDFLQWVRAGTEAHGIDLTEASIQHVKNRLQLYGVNAKELKTGDAENIPYPSDFFDLVYSWGVIMHTPDTAKALGEIIRVVKPGGEVKLMVYNRHSLCAFYLWLKHAFFKGRPWKSLSWCLFHFQESAGTKAFTVTEFRRMIERHSVSGLEINTHLTYTDTLSNSRKFLVRIFGAVVSRALHFSRFGWLMTIHFRKAVS